MASTESSSDPKDSSGDEASSSSAAMVSSDPPSEENIPMVSSDPSSEENIPYAEQLQRDKYIDSAGSSEDETGPSGFTTDELIYKALSTVYEDGNHGLDIDGIFNFVTESYDVLDNFRDKLEEMLADLLSEGQVEMVGNRYRIPQGLFDTPAQSEDTPNPTQSKSSEESKTQDAPSASSSAPQVNPQVEAVARLIAEAGVLELQAKEAQELADRLSVLELESDILLELAEETRNRCANGEKVYLR